MHNHSTRIQANCRVSTIRAGVDDLMVPEDGHGSWAPSRERRAMKDKMQITQFSFGHLAPKTLAGFGRNRNSLQCFPPKNRNHAVTEFFCKFRHRYQNRNRISVDHYFHYLDCIACAGNEEGSQYKLFRSCCLRSATAVNCRPRDIFTRIFKTAS